MNSFKKIVAVTLVTALCLLTMCVPAFAVTVNSDFSALDYFNAGYFIPSPDYPTAETLPYGGDTLIYEIPKRVNNGIQFYRVYIRRDMDIGSVYSIWNGTTSLCTVDSQTASIRNMNYQFSSKAPIYYQTFTIAGDSSTSFEFSSITKINSGNVYDGVTYPTFSLQGKMYGVTPTVGYFYPSIRCSGDALIGGRVADPQVIVNFPNYERFPYIRTEDNGTYYLTPANARYPSSSDLQGMRDKITNEKLDGIQDSIDSGFDELVGSVTAVAQEIKGAINEGVSDIINAGDDLPTVDTDNGWMNDSVTKVNEWLSQLEDFDQQMDENLAENQSNLKGARDFLASFFNSIPSVLVAALSLGLVMIVVVKVIGR